MNPLKNYPKFMRGKHQHSVLQSKFFLENFYDSISLRRQFIFWAIILLFSATATLVAALEPPTQAQIEQYRADGTLDDRIISAKVLGNHKASRDFVARSHRKLQEISLQLQGRKQMEINQILAPPPAWEGMPTSGTVKVLTLLIAFDDYDFSNSAASISSKIYGEGSGGYPIESLHNYYQRSSYNQLDIQGNALGWYTTDYPRSTVPQNRAGRENLIKEVLNYYDTEGHDFSQYDNDDDGDVDYFLIIWTGPHNGWSNFWWGYQTEFSNSSYIVDGKSLSTYSWQWEANPYPGTFSPRTAIHETGHALGLPDLYDYDGNVGPDGGVGGLDMMHGNEGDHNCYSKFVLDWIVPRTFNSGSQRVTLRASGSTQDAALVMPDAIDGVQFAEFFMIQNRFRVNNDTKYPGDGLLIWHIDARLDSNGYDYLYNNSFTNHKLVRLMEADGIEEIEANGSADAEDYYTAGDIFGPDTTPNSNRY